MSDAMLHRHVSPQTLGLARIAVFGMWWWHVLRDPMPQRARELGALVEPIGVLRLLPEDLWPLLSSPAAASGLRAGLLVALAALVAGVGPFRPIAAVTCALLVVYQALVRGVGYVTHGELPMLYAALALAPFPCADGLSLRRGPVPSRPEAGYRAPMVAAALALCLTYAFVAARRLQVGGPGIFLDGTILHWLALRGVERHALGALVLEHAWLARAMEAGFAIVSACELAAPLALFAPRFRVLFLAVMVGFHALTAALMAISFRGNLVLLAVFVTDSDRAVRRAAGAWRALLRTAAR